MNWGAFALKVPALVMGAVEIAERIRDAKGRDKKAAVEQSIPNAIELIEFAAERDVLNDEAIKTLISASIDAEAAALKAREALRLGILAKQPSA